MALVPNKLAFEVLVCDFCGSIHLSKIMAENNGCTKEISNPPKFKVGDIVSAVFRVGDGLEDVGRYRANGKVTSVIRPKEFTPESEVPEELYTRHNTGKISFSTRIAKHDWKYAVWPIDEHPEKNKYMIRGTFYEEQLDVA